jgi:hypothetical protein
MKTTLLLLTGFLSGGLNAQNDQVAIGQWQSLHPTTLLISSERFNLLSEAERALLGNDYVVFEERISLEQLRQYDAVKNSVAGEAPATKEEDAAAIKQWKGTHQDIKLVPRSYFESLDAEKQLLYTEDPYCLVLLGETLTVKDIELFAEH